MVFSAGDRRRSRGVVPRPSAPPSPISDLMSQVVHWAGARSLDRRHHRPRGRIHALAAKRWSSFPLPAARPEPQIGFAATWRSAGFPADASVYFARRPRSHSQLRETKWPGPGLKRRPARPALCPHNRCLHRENTKQCYGGIHDNLGPKRRPWLTISRTLIFPGLTRLRSRRMASTTCWCVRPWLTCPLRISMVSPCVQFRLVGCRR